MRNRTWAAAAATAAICLGLAACGGSDSPADATIQSLSNRADLISGGSALVQVTPPTGNTSQLRVDVNGTDVTSAFKTLGRVSPVLPGCAPGSDTLPGHRPLNETAVRRRA